MKWENNKEKNNGEGKNKTRNNETIAMHPQAFDSIASPKVMTMKRKGVGVHFLARNTLGVHGCVGVPR
jgi:N-acetyl-anhydromuramyl-L-alanine amidase AmpD